MISTVWDEYSGADEKLLDSVRCQEALRERKEKRWFAILAEHKELVFRRGYFIPFSDFDNSEG
jgi:hypothetical protein